MSPQTIWVTGKGLALPRARGPSAEEGVMPPIPAEGQPAALGLPRMPCQQPVQTRLSTIFCIPDGCGCPRPPGLSQGPGGKTESHGPRPRAPLLARPRLLTGLGVHGAHVHLEGPHQGAAAQQVLGVDHLPGTTSSRQSGWGAGLRLSRGQDGGTDGGTTSVFLGTQASG